MTKRPTIAEFVRGTARNPAARDVASPLCGMQALVLGALPGSVERHAQARLDRLEARLVEMSRTARRDAVLRASAPWN